ncbi:MULTISPECIES: hypothetical protein [Methylomonas]|uniref:hypothetical protein n=1 Tax=Methylomonas TaxID=416 RepID=UPI001231C398|nr:hypothetical protein [Methylomonas rhizoryzae]
MFYAIAPIFAMFVLWLGYKILLKAGLDGRWTLILLVPIVNIIMIWIFAFCRWPNLRSDVKQDL